MQNTIANTISKHAVCELANASTVEDMQSAM